MAVHTPEVGNWTTVSGAITIQSNRCDMPDGAYLQKSIPPENQSKFVWSCQLVSFKPTGANKRSGRILLVGTGGIFRVIEVFSTTGTSWEVEITKSGPSGNLLQSWTGQTFSFPLYVSIQRANGAYNYVVGGLTFSETTAEVMTTAQVDCFFGGGVIDNAKLESIP